MDYRQIASRLGLIFNPDEKSKYASAVKNIIHKGLKCAEDAEEIKKSGVKIKTIRLEKNGTVKEHMSFDNIDFKEVLESDDWIDSQWYNIITTRYMFVIFRKADATDGSWGKESRYVLDKMFFWTMPASDFHIAEKFWENIRQNVLNDTLSNESNNFWRIKDHLPFHVRPKAKDSNDNTISPISGTKVPKKAYWFDKRYLMREIQNAYGSDWEKIIKNK